MREILPDILTWSRFSEPHGYDFNGYLIRDPGGNERECALVTVLGEDHEVGVHTSPS